MNTAYPHIPFLPREHGSNRDKIPLEVIAQYRGQYVAYSWDGSHIVSGASSEEMLYHQLKTAGIDMERVVIGFIDDE